MTMLKAMTRLGELLAGVAVAGAIVFYTRFITIDPLDRISQVSAMAALQVPTTIIGIVIVVALAFGYRRRTQPDGQALITVAWSAISGIPTGLVAAGARLALQGAPYPLLGGDTIRLAKWTEYLVNRDFASFQREYPPLMPSLVAIYSQLTGETSFSAWKTASILSLAVIGPVAYLSARLVLKRGWALIAPLSFASLYEAYKPFVTLSLIIMIPLIVRLGQLVLSPSPDQRRKSALASAGLGGALGLTTLLYSGWFAWSIPGVLCLAIYALYKSPNKRQSLINGASAIGSFTIIAGYYLYGVITGPPIEDDFKYFETYIDPAYFVISLGSMPGAQQKDLWPPPGELGGVGVFMLLLIAGSVIACMLGWRHTLVKFLALSIPGFWLIRMYLAGQMGETGLVQLYPRTSAILFVFMVFLTGIAVKEIAERVKLSPQLRLRGAVAAACGLILLFSIIGSSVMDQYWPVNDDSLGILAWNSHHPEMVLS